MCIETLPLEWPLLLLYLLRNASMLFILILVRLITDLIDAPVFSLKDPDLIGLIIIFTICCYLPAILGLRYLWKKYWGSI